MFLCLCSGDHVGGALCLTRFNRHKVSQSSKSHKTLLLTYILTCKGGIKSVNSDACFIATGSRSWRLCLVVTVAVVAVAIVVPQSCGFMLSDCRVRTPTNDLVRHKLQPQNVHTYHILYGTTKNSMVSTQLLAFTFTALLALIPLLGLYCVAFSVLRLTAYAF